MSGETNGLTGVELISVHTPKCAGIALQRALAAAYPRGGLYPDYGDFPADPAARMHLDPDGFLADAWGSGYSWLVGRRAVHGHFWLRKYDRIPNAARITFLREPVDRIISLYFYWRSLEDPGHPMVRHIAMYQPDVAAFAEMEWTRTFLTRRFFRDVGVERFDFIGFHEEMERDLAALSQMMGRDLSLPRSNVNAHPGYEEEVARIRADRALMARLEAATVEERRFYDAARARFG